MASQNASPSASSAPATSGLVTAAGFAELGSDVWCIDIDADKVARLKRGEIPIYEPGLDGAGRANRERLHFSTDIADALEHARLLFVAVGTPPTYSGDADLSAVYAVVDAMPRLRPPRARHEVDRAGRHRRGDQAPLPRAAARRASATSPARSSSRRARRSRTSCNPDRVVVGDDGDWAGDAVVELYAPLDAPLVRTDIASAEMVKLASNAFLATKISFINEIANVCEETGADVIEVAQGNGPRRPHRAEVPAGRAWASAAPAFRRTSPRSSSSPATRATTSSCSTPSSRSTSCRSAA